MAAEAYTINGLSLVVSNPDGGVDAVGFLTLGETYLVAAEKLLPNENSFIPTIGSPESFLAGRALELYLKSFLLARGTEVDYLKKNIGHNLKRCLENADERGISKIVPISPVLRQSIDLLSYEYAKKHLECFLGSGRAVRPDLRRLLPEIRNAYEALQAIYVDASKAERAGRIRSWR